MESKGEDGWGVGVFGRRWVNDTAPMAKRLERGCEEEWRSVLRLARRSEEFSEGEEESEEASEG